VTTRDPPLLSERDGAELAIDPDRRKATYFCGRDWTTQITLKWLAKSQPARSAFLDRRLPKAKLDDG
jgi:hypothetical protein